MNTLPLALEALGAYRQFINYKLVPRPDGSMDKVPLNPHTSVVSGAHDPAIWVSFEEASAMGLPVGFVFTAADPFFFLDVDHCKDDQGAWTNMATALCNMFTGCAVEVSQSGEGLHIFGRVPEHLAHGSDCKIIGSQFYTEKRFVALTGAGAQGDANFTPPVETYRNLVNSYFPPKIGPQGPAAEWTTEPVEEYTGPEDDQELVEKMLKSKSGRGILGAAATVKQLWEADAEALGKQFPDDHGTQGRAFDWSLADAALYNHLAFWTGKDCERIQRIFEMSALSDRAKWEDREAYRVNTILGAVAVCKSVYNKPKKAPLAPEPGPIVEGMRTGWQIRTVQDQVEAFRGCVYVRDIHRIFTPDGALLKPEQFRAVYGGYSYGLDATNEKVTKNAWEAFTESQAYSFPKAHKPCFRPELEPGALVNYESGVFVNTYVPILTDSTQGDPAPFLDLVARLLSDPNDQAIILAYMAAVTQYPGVKFQWAPLLQGVQGNGKSFLGSVLTFCVGEKYTHLPDPKDLASVFNAWIQGKLLITNLSIFLAYLRYQIFI